jgi:uncharacterized membrane protein YccC
VSPRRPPALALKAAGSALLPVVLVGVGVTAVGDVVGLAWFLLGVVAALPVATHAVPWSDRVLLVALGVVAAVLGLASSGRLPAAAAVVAVVSLLQAPLSRRTPGGGAMVPVLAAVAASTGLPDEPWTTALALVAGAGTIILTTTALGIRATAAPVPAALAWRHAVALAVTAALALGLVMQQQVTHGYWLVLTLALVLRPARDETRTLARDRVVGTVLGLAAGVAAVVLLPTWAVLAVAAPCVLLTAAWGMAGDNRRATAYAAPLLVLLGSSGLAGSGVALALERTLFTLAGVGLAAAVAYALDVVDRRTTPALGAG